MTYVWLHMCKWLAKDQKMADGKLNLAETPEGGTAIYGLYRYVPL